MYTIEKIRIENEVQLAKQIAEKLPKLDVEFDSSGEWCENIEFDISIHEINLSITGTLSGNAEGRISQHRTHEVPEIWETVSKNIEVTDIHFWPVEGYEIEVSNEWEIITQVNKLLGG